MSESRVFSVTGLVAALLLAAGASGQKGEVLNAPQILAAASFSGPVHATVERVLDGDTIEVRADIWLEQSVTVRVRIDGVDTPEREADCAAEREKAEAARAFLQERIEGVEIVLSRIVYDKYGGRVRASVTDSRGDIAQALMQRGLARPYRGGKRGSWCVPA